MRRSTQSVRPGITLVGIAVGATLAFLGCGAPPETISMDGPQPCGTGLDKIAKVGDLDIAYRQYGPTDGSAMILIGGTGQQLVDWPPDLIEGLVAKGYRVTIFDSRDSGCSTHLKAEGPAPFEKIIAAMSAGEPPPVAYSLETVADDTRGLMDSLQLDRANIVGVSGGAIAAEMFAAKYPDQTLSLTVIAPNSGNPAIRLPADPDRFAGLPPAPPAVAPRDQITDYVVATSHALQSRSHPRSEEELRAVALRDIERSYDPEGLSRQQAAALVTPDLRERLAKIDTPTVVIQGDEDPIIPRAMAEDVAKAVPNARLVVLNGMGHDLPAAVIPEIVEAIESATP